MIVTVLLLENSLHATETSKRINLDREVIVHYLFKLIHCVALRSKTNVEVMTYAADMDINF